MDIHVCKQCGAHFVYCRACVFRPIRYKDAGFCSKECYEASKNNVVESEIIEEVVAVEEPKQINEDVEFIEEKNEVEAIVPIETPVIETITVVEPIIKKETNTYKKKKSKH